jgi:hypothetical protein
MRLVEKANATGRKGKRDWSKKRTRLVEKANATGRKSKLDKTFIPSALSTYLESVKRFSFCTNMGVGGQYREGWRTL